MLEHYWPKAERVNECIKNEAETADVAVLMAVHQPTPLVKRAVGTGRETPASEQELLEAFLVEDVPGGALLMPITGPSGVGKSHIIRWLDAQLQRSPKRDRLHIIRVPKSASLRKVVELILEPLADNPDFEVVRKDLARAVAEVDVASAVVTFRAHLENALTAYSRQLGEDLRLDPSRQELRPLVGHARDLPKLFADPALAQYFADNVLSRVIKRALHGHHAEDAGDETLSQFLVEDLTIPEDAVDLAEASQPVRQYYMASLSRADGAQRKAIVDLLNKVVDTAIARVFQLEQSTSGVTLQDIILAVREMLLKSGRDLVLLVEDFAALAGIQEALLKVAIQEGVYEGKKVRATMRTAIALTDGYLAFRDTILTRAQREWVIGGKQLSDAEVLQSVEGLVGSYLDAARWGSDELRRKFIQAPDISRSDWLDPWRYEAHQEGEAEALEAFGFDGHQRSLFPFNRAAIFKLAERHLLENQRLSFNPRRVINEILRAPLLMREAYERGEFPPSEFGESVPNVFVSKWVQSASLATSERRRLSSFLMAWGGAPQDEEAISHLPPPIFAAFGLPTPYDFKRVEYAPEAKEAKTAPKQEAPVDEERDEESVVALRQRLDEWVNGAELNQSEARTLRNGLGLLLKGAVQWGALRLREQSFSPASIYIPQARGGSSGGLQLKVCDVAKDETGVLRLGLLAAHKFEIRGKHWDYPGGDDDYVAATAIVDRLAAQLQDHAIAQAEKEVAVLARGLITQARIAGLAPPVRGKDADTLAAVFEQVGSIETANEAWRAVVDHSLVPFLAGKPARESLQHEVFSRAGAFQGTGSLVHAIDGVRIIAALEAATGDETGELSQEYANYLRQISPNRLWSAVSKVISDLEQFKTDVSELTEPDFDKRAFVEDLKAIAVLLGQTGTWQHTSWLKIADVEQQIQAFQASGVMELMGRLERVLDHAEREKLPTLLNELGRFDFALTAQLVTFLKSANELVRMAANAKAQAASLATQAKPEAIADEISDLLLTIETKLFAGAP